MIDWLQPSEEHAAASNDELGMARLPKIWPGFSTDAIKFDVVVFSEPIEVPQEMERYSRMFMAKAKPGLKWWTQERSQDNNDIFN